MIKDLLYIYSQNYYLKKAVVIDNLDIFDLILKLYYFSRFFFKTYFPLKQAKVSISFKVIYIFSHTLLRVKFKCCNNLGNLNLL